MSDNLAAQQKANEALGVVTEISNILGESPLSIARCLQYSSNMMKLVGTGLDRETLAICIGAPCNLIVLVTSHA